MANPIIRNEAVRDAKLDNTSEYLDEQKNKEKERQEAENLAAEEAKIRKNELVDSHAAKDPSQFGTKENVAEVGKATVGGIRDTASSILTAPERYWDMATGQMGKDYVPDWNPLKK